ncbi:hypothetical protein QTP88_004343 [Uroleucon formosanum]
MGGVRCAAKGCKNCMKIDNHYMYHRFPSIKDRNFRICSVHFEPKMYSNPEKTRLLPQAMPTLFINTHVTQEIPMSMIDENSLATTADGSTCSTVSTSSQTTQKLSVNTPRKKKLKTEVSLLKAKCAKLEKQVETLSLKDAAALLCLLSTINIAYEIIQNSSNMPILYSVDLYIPLIKLIHL